MSCLLLCRSFFVTFLFVAFLLLPFLLKLLDSNGEVADRSRRVHEAAAAAVRLAEALDTQ